ncbi:hypothetical protein DL96DRAFT_1529951 [Flagelloscypha sp. PMI_526]|nr:hypothetical protein DL96DRAFT_1529951 [Flagelloscypha sp. PMI_526]
MPDYFIENISPLIQYEPEGLWREGDKVKDLEAFRYSGNSSFTVTKSAGTSASFNFTGTSVIVSGARRPNHGQYSVTLDGLTSTFNGQNSQDPGDFRVALFKATDLEPIEHTLTIRNLPQGDQKFLDIDFIQWSSPGVGDDNSQLRVVEDTAFKFEPEDAWSDDVSSFPGFSNGDGHSTSKNGASAAINFQGTGVSLFGAVGPNQASYSVALDGGPLKSFNAFKTDYYPEQMLYSIDRLASGDHTLTFTCNSSDQQSCAVDYAVVYYTDFGKGKTGSALSKGAIAGIVIGVLVVLGLLISALVLFIRRRRHIKRTTEWRNGYASRAANRPPSAQSGILPTNTAPTLPPAYQPPSPNSRIAAWANQTRQATLETLKVRPPDIRTMTQVDSPIGSGSFGDSYVFTSPNNAIASPERVLHPPHSLPFQSSASPVSISHNPSLRPSLPPPKPPSSPTPSSFWPILKGKGKEPVEATPDPSFGRDMGNGKKFVDLVG